jgi:mannose-6-phosphate isomerase-like protein (cupin superfamily)
MLDRFLAEALQEMNVSRTMLEIACPAASREAITSLVERAGQSAAQLLAGADRILAKPYGRNVIATLGSDFGISLVQMRPGQSTSSHFHRTRMEVFLIRSGTLCFYEGDQMFVLERGCIAASKPGRPHRLANEGKEELEFIELFVPGDLNDKVRLNDHYGRPLGQVSHRD